MSLLSIIGTGIAFANYRKAKKEYEQLKEKQETLEAAVATYNEYKQGKVYPEVEKVLNSNSITHPDGLLVTSVLKVANLVGRIFYAKPSLVITNTTKEEFLLEDVDVQCSVYGEVVGVTDKFVFPQTIHVLPNETLEISAINKSKAGFASPDTIVKLRDEICALNGKKLITSCGKTNIEGVETARISFKWAKAKKAKAIGEYQKAEWIDKPGVLRYCMELSLIGE